MISRTSRAFDEFAPTYASAFETNALARWARNRARHFYRQHLPLRGTVADLGCGPGLDAIHLARGGTRVVGIDFSPRMIEMAMTCADEAGVSSLARFAVADIRDPAALSLIVPDEVDAVLLGFGVLNDCSTPEDVFRSIDGISRPRSTVILSWLNRSALWDAAWHACVGRRPPRWGQQPRVAKMCASEVPVYYWTTREIVSTVRRRGWAVECAEGVGVVAPPPYAEGRLPRHLESALCALDARLGPTRASAVADMVWICART